MQKRESTKNSHLAMSTTFYSTPAAVAEAHVFDLLEAALFHAAQKKVQPAAKKSQPPTPTKVQPAAKKIKPTTPTSRKSMTGWTGKKGAAGSEARDALSRRKLTRGTSGRLHGLPICRTRSGDLTGVLAGGIARSLSGDLSGALGGGVVTNIKGERVPSPLTFRRSGVSDLTATLSL